MPLTLLDFTPFPSRIASLLKYYTSEEEEAAHGWGWEEEKEEGRGSILIVWHFSKKKLDKVNNAKLLGGPLGPQGIPLGSREGFLSA